MRKNEMSESGSKPVDSQTEQDSSEALKAELALYRKLKPFIAESLTLNHDINNPLAGILGYAEYMLMDSAELTPEQRSNLEQVLECAERIEKIVTGLSDLKVRLATQMDIEEFVRTYRPKQTGSE